MKSLSECDKILDRWSPEAMMQTKAIADVQLSPKNDAALFVATEALMTEDKSLYLSRIYHVKADGSNLQPLFLAETSSTQPRWSPNGEWIAFLLEKEGKKNLHLIRPNGQEERCLFSGKKSVQTFAWAPDSLQIAFIMEDETELKKSKKNSKAFVYQERLFINRLWLLEAFAPESSLKALTSDAYCVRGLGDGRTQNTEFEWSPDGSTLIFAYSPALGPDMFHIHSSIASLNLATGDVTEWKKSDRYEALPRYSPDGRFVAYLTGNTETLYSIDRRLAIRSAKGKHTRYLALTFNEGAFLVGASLLGWTAEGKHLLFLEPKHTKYHIVKVPIDGSEPQELQTQNLYFEDPVLSFDRTHLGFPSQSLTSPPEAFIANLTSFHPKQLSNLNAGQRHLPQLRTEKLSWMGANEFTIEGLLTYPVSYNPEKKYPLLLIIHGGPMGFYTEEFVGMPRVYPTAAFAQEGYFVLRANPRGSTGYGRAFRIANYFSQGGSWGGEDLTDLLKGVESLINKGLVDSERLGVMGWSYGGYLTAWALTQTTVFKVASAGAGPYNLVSLSGTTDLHSFMIDYLGDFLENPTLYQERSPLYFSKVMNAPLLLQHGTADPRVPCSQAHEFYHTLKRLQKQVQLVLYPNTGHAFTEPKLHLDALKLNLQWFKTQL